ncbi:MAG: ChaN family lipoprotein [Alkalinema sp. RL_2_19]|nr:ChaN family lipoprotein [Alkalinema sp. RL_2_19]
MSASPQRLTQRLQGFTIRLTTLLCLSGLLWVEPQLAASIAASNLPLEFADSQGQILTTDQLWQRLSPAQVVYLGETHEQAADHAAQLTIIQALHQRNPQIMIGMEMFQRPYQSAIDRYLAGTLSEADFLDRTEYATRWGFDWELYAPILRYAKAQKIPVIALNTPREVTRKVSRQGLSRLNFSDRRFIPPLSAIRTAPDAYRQMLAKVFQDAHHGHGNAKGFERFFQAQVLWDETMAERISQVLRQNPTHQVVVLVGQGHLVYRYGIPDRVARRFPDRITQQVLLLSPDPNLPAQDQTGQPIADLLRQTSATINPQNSTPTD